MRILVTGGPGFIGRHIVQHFQDLAEVRVLDNLRSGFERNLNRLKCDFMKGSILDRDIVRRAVHGVDSVFHLAAMISVPESVQQAIECVEINSVGTPVLLEACPANFLEHRIGWNVFPLWMLRLFLVVMPVTVEAQYTYTTNNGTVTVTQYSGPGGAVTIPTTIAGLPVTSIADFAFDGISNLNSVAIPNSVTNIGFETFYNCPNLTGVTIPGSVTSIGGWAFQNCTNLLSITVDALNSVYSSMDGILFNRSQTVLIAYPGGKAGTYAIPSTITSIAVGAFGGCTSLTNVTIPNGVTNIGDSAFYSCSQLATVTIPHSVTKVGNSAFYSCASLASATIGNSVAGIGDYAFASCASLARVTIGSGVANIGYGAFLGCGLTSLSIPDGVNAIGDAAFEYCSNLTSVIVGKGVTDIADFAFDACNSLTNVTLANGLTSIGVDSFGRCSSLTSIAIPGSVTNIGAAAFYNCTSLDTITIPNSVVSIGNSAFSVCTSLTQVYFQGNAPSDGGSAFGGDGDVTLYYLPYTVGWGATYDGLRTVPWNPQVQTGEAGFGVRSGRFGFRIIGATNLVFVVEASANLASSVWSALQTNELANGSVFFSDPLWTNYPTRFYRLRSP